MDTTESQGGAPRRTNRPTLHRRGSRLADPGAQRSVLGAVGIGSEFEDRLAGAQLFPLRAQGIGVLQINVGRLCNQTCVHCHVDAGPDRTEDMDLETARRCMEVLAESEIPTVDITGGAPEMSRSFEYLVKESHRLGRHVLVRCNLTILLSKRFEHLPRFYADHGVEVIASLPHYRSLNTDRQRGDGVFDRSIEALGRLNREGYGREPGRRLVLVTNPVGAFLPAGQAALEREWKLEMKRRHDIDFDALYTITNLPISRYLEWLEDSGNLQSYLCTLVDAFNPEAAAGVMCRSMISVDWRGGLHDCDFNQMLEMGVAPGVPAHIDEFDAGVLGQREILTGRHCYGCTAGSGSSCGGSLG